MSKDERRYKQPTRPKITKDFDNEELIRGTVNLPAHIYEALRKEALEHGVSMGSIIRDAIGVYLERGAHLAGKGISMNKKLFLEFLDEFTVDEREEGFEDEGEQSFDIEGFLAEVKERILDPSKVWTEDFLKETAKRYAIGFKDAEPQDLDKHIERSSVAMKLTPQQKSTWAELLKSEIEAEEEEEEW